MNNTLTLTLNHPLTESDWDKICDVELEKTKHIWFETSSGKRVDFIRADILDVIRAEIERLHYHPKLDFIKNDKVVEMALDIIDKYKAEQGLVNDNKTNY